MSMKRKIERKQDRKITLKEYNKLAGTAMYLRGLCATYIDVVNSLKKQGKITDEDIKNTLAKVTKGSDKNEGKSKKTSKSTKDTKKD